MQARYQHSQLCSSAAVNSLPIKQEMAASELILSPNDSMQRASA